MFCIGLSFCLPFRFGADGAQNRSAPQSRPSRLAFIPAAAGSKPDAWSPSPRLDGENSSAQGDKGEKRAFALKRLQAHHLLNHGMNLLAFRCLPFAKPHGGDAE